MILVPLVATPRRFGRFLAPILGIAALWVVVSVPLGVYYLRHPADVEGHTDDVSMLNPANNHGDPVGALLHGTVVTLAAIDFHGSDGGEQNLPGRPLLDPIQSAFFFVGLAALAWGCVSKSSVPTVRRAHFAPIRRSPNPNLAGSSPCSW